MLVLTVPQLNEFRYRPWLLVLTGEWRDSVPTLRALRSLPVAFFDSLGYLDF